MAKRVGILTFHASHNYGSVLQAYALSKQLEIMGYHPEIINLRNQAQREAYRTFQTKGVGLKKILHTLYAISIYPAAVRRTRNFETFINQILPITKQCFTSGRELRGTTNYDLYLCGSDQVWNPACQDFESAYYLDFVTNGAKRISYAPSLGKASFKENDLTTIRELLENIDCISCREADGAAILRNLTDKPVTEVCDPVVLLGRKNWDKFAQKPDIDEPYILTYFLENNHGGKQYLDKLKAQTGYRVICLNEDIRDLGKGYTHKIDVTPQEFVGLFQYAALVYTNSFHGTAFSTIFNRPFLTVVGRSYEVNNNDSRKICYLRSLGLQGRIVLDQLPSSEVYLQTDDLLLAERKIDVIRETSYQYLKSALEC